MQIAQKSSCEVATAAKPDSPGYHYQLRPCQLDSRVVDPSAINGTHGTLNRRTEGEMPKITLNIMPPRYTPPKDFGNLLPQVNFQTPLQVDRGTFTPIRPWLKTDRMYKNEMKTNIYYTARFKGSIQNPTIING